MIDLQERISGEVYADQVGATVDVLVEGPAKKSPEHSYGRALDFKGVVIDCEIAANTALPVVITGSSPHTLFGTPA